LYGHRHWKKIRTTFPGRIGELFETGKFYFGGDWVRYSGGIGTRVIRVRNPMTQRLTVFSEDASVSKKIIHFFSPG